MTPEEIPQELKDIVNKRAGKDHSDQGLVMQALAEVLTRWEEIRGWGPVAWRKGEQRLVPVNMGHSDLLALLNDVISRVEEGDSFEGSFQYLLPHDPDASPHSFDVQASYRIGNTMGQGGLRMVGAWATAPGGSPE